MKGLLDEQDQQLTAETGSSDNSDVLDGVSDQARPIVKRAVELVYGEGFEELVQMFEASGPQGFAQAMSTAINGVLERLAKEFGELPTELIAEVGLKLFESLLEDLVAGGVIDPTALNGDSIMQTITQTLSSWGRKNPDKFDPEMMAQGISQAATDAMPKGVVNGN